MQLNYDEMMALCDTKKELRAKEELVDGKFVTIFSYMVSMVDTFDSDLAREFRGTTFLTETKECICRPLVKFFNVGEKEDTQPNLINWDDAEFYTKHDGSMLTPVLINDKVVWKTKNTFYSDVAIAAQKFYDKMVNEGTNVDFPDPIDEYTFIFEYVGPNNQIVLPYEKEELIYIGKRNIETGEYYPNPLLKTSDVTYEDVFNMEEIEGFVIWDGNQLVKAKSNWYMERHKITSEFNVKAIIHATLDNTVDDMLATIAQLGLTLRYYQVQTLRSAVINELLAVLDEIDVYWNVLQPVLDKERKEQALFIQANVPKPYHSIMFKRLDGKKFDDIVNKIVFTSAYERHKSEILEDDE